MPDEAFTEDELRRIWVGAESLAERKEIGSCNPGSLSNNDLGRFRKKRWLTSAAAGDHELFTSLLQCQGLEPNTCSSYLLPIQQRMDARECLWLPRLKKTLIQMLDRSEENNPPPAASKKYLLPFEEIFYSVLSEAENERDENLEKICGSNLKDTVPPAARTAMQRALMVRLCGLSAEIFFRNFDHLRSASAEHISSLSSLSPNTNGSRKIYTKLIRRHRHNFIKESILNFPVLARLICLAIDQWIETTSEVLQRLTCDIHLIRSTFRIDSANHVERITSLGSDPHLNGRSTWAIKFSNSKIIVYKPRSLALDCAWMAWLKWLSERGAPPSAGSLIVCDQGIYGWMEWAEHGPTETATESFFLRFGAVLCLAHIFNANDLHYENVVVSGATPHIVDLETLFHPRGGLRAEEEQLDEMERAARNSLRNTVAWTKLLPAWMKTYDLDAFPIGALNPMELEDRREVRFVDTNTDSMRIERVLIGASETKSLPQGFVGAQWASHGAPLLCRGFQEMWEFLTEHKHFILKAAGPLEPFRNTQIRVLLKPTQLYFFALKRSLSAEFLVDGGVWDSQHQILCRFLDKPQIALRWFSVLREELKALARLDVPYFSVPCDGNTLLSDGAPILEEAFTLSPFQSVYNRIQNMTRSDKEAQTFLISQSVLALDEPPTVPAKGLVEHYEHEIDLIQEACEIGRLLLRSSVDGKGYHWIGLAPLVRTRHRQIQGMGLDLYSGSCGNALFFAALAAATNNEAWNLAAKRALTPILTIFQDQASAQRLARTIGIGAGTGLGGLAYSLIKIGSFLKHEELHEYALLICNHITHNIIEQERNLDALSGAAGAILSLLFVAAKTNKSWLIDRALTLGERILSLAEAGSGGTAFWRGQDESIEFGMAHGIAGISLSLYRLGKATGMVKYTKAALLGFSFEHESEVRGGYYHSLSQSLSHDTRHALACRWCRGSSGLALANLKAYDNFQHDLSNQLSDLSSSLVNHLLTSEDNLCCGNFGRIEFLLSTGLHLQDETLIFESRLAAKRLVNRRNLSGSFASRAHDALNPGFFTGISGIGYQLLRVNEPASFSNVLCWE